MRVLDKLTTLHAQALVTNALSTFEPERPWNSVWKALALGEQEWWMKELRLPGIEILARVAHPEKFIEGDAPVRSSGTKRTAPLAVTDRSPPKRPAKDDSTSSWQHPRQNHQHQNRGGGAGASGTRHPVYDKDANQYITTRSGIRICKGYSRGSCTKVDKFNRCAQDNSSAHQCAVCLMTGHAAWETTKCPKQKADDADRPNRARDRAPSPPPANRGGRQRGKGKRK